MYELTKFFLFRYFKSLCARELSKFSARSVRGAGTLANARRLKNYFTLLHNSYLFLTKPLGHPVETSLEFGDEFVEDEKSVQEPSNFARRMQLTQRSMASTPLSTPVSVAAPSNSSAVQRSAPQILDDTDASQYDEHVHVPRAVTTKRDRDTDGASQQLSSSPNTRRTKSAPVNKPAGIVKTPPSCSHDKHLRYLPTSTLGAHAGGGILYFLIHVFRL